MILETESMETSHAQLKPFISTALQKGVSFLKRHQYPYGEFCSYYAPDDRMEEYTVPCSSVFPTALIVTCLQTLDRNDIIENMLKQAVSFFQYQTMRGGAMNYFTKWNDYFTMCSADIDDTIFVSEFFKSRNVEHVNPNSILLANRARTGLFYTWFSFRFNKSKNKDYWMLLLREFKNPINLFIRWRHFGFNGNDIDGVVNANVLYYYGKNNVTKPIIQYLVDIVRENREENCDKWYRRAIVFYYFYSRNIQKGVPELEVVAPEIVEKISKLKKTSGCIGASPLDTALAVTSLIRLKYKGSLVVDGVNYLLNSQREDGEWPRHILYYSGPKKEVGWGSEEMTTAFCLEALNLWNKT